MPKKSPTWPPLPFEEWQDTCETVHLWTQILGKVRLAREVPVNHYWHVPLYVTASGLTTSCFPVGDRTMELALDFHTHQLTASTSDGRRDALPLVSQPIAEFYAKTMAWLASLGAGTTIVARPNEVDPAIPFAEDRVHGAYNPEQAERFLQTLIAVDRVMKIFRARFLGKSSPVHFFWGSFDHAVTRFSGRPAPPHPGGVPNLPDYVARESYSHEVSSAGFWPGNRQFPEPIFYSYAYPEPPGFAEARIGPGEARYHEVLREFVLPYEAVRSAADPDSYLLEFFDTTYAAAADLAKWDRAALERA